VAPEVPRRATDDPDAEPALVGAVQLGLF
jgi:hypothetical protein